jgi:hypothetical protein
MARTSGTSLVPRLYEGLAIARNTCYVYVARPINFQSCTVELLTLEHFGCTDVPLGGASVVTKGEVSTFKRSPQAPPEALRRSRYIPGRCAASE